MLRHHLWSKLTRYSWSAPRKTIATTLNDFLTGPDFPDFWVIDLTWKVKDLKIGYHRLALVTGNTLVFPRSSSSIKGQTGIVCVWGGQRTPSYVCGCRNHLYGPGHGCRNVFESGGRGAGSQRFKTSPTPKIHFLLGCRPFIFASLLKSVKKTWQEKIGKNLRGSPVQKLNLMGAPPWPPQPRCHQGRIQENSKGRVMNRSGAPTYTRN